MKTCFLLNNLDIYIKVTVRYIINFNLSETNYASLDIIIIYLSFHILRLYTYTSRFNIAHR
jgi:hypothetical protein